MGARLEITPREALERLASELGLSSKDVATALGIEQRTVDRWKTGETYPQREARGRLAALVALSESLRQAFADREGIREWLDSPSRYLGGMRPAEAIKIGRADRAEAALEALKSGIFI